MAELAWYEVWADEGLSPPYILLLLRRQGEEAFDVFDPKEDRVIHRASTYEAARFWLLEDEYTQVRGRMIIE